MLFDCAHMPCINGAAVVVMNTLLLQQSDSNMRIYVFVLSSSSVMSNIMGYKGRPIRLLGKTML
jgi:hypothetical protein